MFRFTIRDVLWLTVAVALGVGWWLDRSRLVFQYEDKLHETEIFMYSELERVEREVDAAWEKNLTRMLETVKNSEKPATDDAP